jgi:hypothetical protein
MLFIADLNHDRMEWEGRGLGLQMRYRVNVNGGPQVRQELEWGMDDRVKVTEH